jgi:cbb3-type cytochrome oxidase subunit 3
MKQITLIIVSAIIIYFIYMKSKKSQFNDKLSGSPLTNEQPSSH